MNERKILQLVILISYVNTLAMQSLTNLSKAFDKVTVCHHLLKLKMSFYSIGLDQVQSTVMKILVTSQLLVRSMILKVHMKWRD